MKTIVLTLLLFLLSQLGFSQTFSIDSKGIVKCKTAAVGAKGVVNGVEYEAVDRSLLIQRRDQGADLTKVCTSLVTDMYRMFSYSQFNQPIGTWDVSSVTEMESMFSYSIFNQSIYNRDVSKVWVMSFMFMFSEFNQQLNTWCVGQIQ